MIRSSRVLPTAVAAMCLIAACGSEQPDATGGTLPAPGDALLAPTPVRVVGASGSGGGADRATSEVAGSDGATDLAMQVQFVEYVLGDVGELPANTTGYVFPAGATVETSRVAAVAEALGVSGDVVAGSPEMGTTWQVGPTDGSAASLTVANDAQLGWWYNAAWDAQGRAVEACATSVDAEGNVIEPTCPEPQPPAGILTADEAEQRARDLLAAMGEDPASFDYEPSADQWFSSVSVTKPIDGIASPLSWGFGFGENGALQYASGSFAVPQAVGPYPLIALDDAFARLQDQGSYWGGGVFLADTTVARVETAVEPADESADEPAVEPPVEPAVDDAAAVPSSAEPFPSSNEAPIEPAPSDGSISVDEPMPIDVVDPLPEPEPVVVTLVGVEADVWWTWDEDGSVWLLPAYRFIGDDEGRYTVPAVTDEFLILVEPDAVPLPEPVPVPASTLPLEPAPVEPAPIDSAPIDQVGEPGTAEPGTPNEPDTVPDETAPGDGFGDEMEPFDRSLLEPSVGASLADFTLSAESLGATVRVVERDGESLAVTFDYRSNRVNVAVDGDTVIRIDSVG